MSAHVAHGHAFCLGALDQPTDDAVVEDNFQSILPAEFVGKFMRPGFEHLRLELVSLYH